MGRPTLHLVPSPPLALDRAPAARSTTWGVRVVHGVEVGAVARSVDDRLRIGRAEGNDLRLTDATVNPHHANLWWDAESRSLVLRDLHTRFGTWWTERRILELLVSEGDRFRVGETELEVVWLQDSDDPP